MYNHKVVTYNLYLGPFPLGARPPVLPGLWVGPGRVLPLSRHHRGPVPPYRPQAGGGSSRARTGPSSGYPPRWPPSLGVLRRKGANSAWPWRRRGEKRLSMGEGDGGGGGGWNSGQILERRGLWVVSATPAGISVVELENSRKKSRLGSLKLSRTGGSRKRSGPHVSCTGEFVMCACFAWKDHERSLFDNQILEDCATKKFSSATTFVFLANTREFGGTWTSTDKSVCACTNQMFIECCKKNAGSKIYL